MQVVDACHGLPVESYYDVAGGQPGALCRAVRLHAGDEHAALGIEAVGPLGEPQQRHVWPATPMRPRRILPCRMSWPVTTFAVLIPTAKQIPCAGRMTAVLTPITRPRESTTGPPELPGLSAASV